MAAINPAFVYDRDLDRYVPRPERASRRPEPPIDLELVGERPAAIDAVDLLALDLPPLRWIVPDLIPERDHDPGRSAEGR